MSRRHTRALTSLALACAVAALEGAAALQACTAFCVVGGGHVLVGNNEDSDNPRTRVWFVAAEPDRFGRMYVGYDDLFPQGGMNERGLWFDGFAAPRVEARGEALPAFDGDLIDEAMATCSTVDEVLQLIARFDRGYLENAILMFADASGDAVSVERNAIVRKTAGHFVQTNFHQSGAVAKPTDRRFVVATEMLAQAKDKVSPELVRSILGATRQSGRYATQYSNIYDLTTRSMRLFEAQGMRRSITFQLDDELTRGSRVLDIAALFDRAGSTDGGEAEPGSQSPSTHRAAAVAGSVAVVALALGLLAMTWPARKRAQSR